jgi:hypothetical protein
MANTKTSRTYAQSEFTSATTVNVTVFAQELADDSSVVQKPSNVYKSGTSVIVDWDGVTVTQATIDAVDADVAAHTGGSFASLPVTEVSESESSDDSGDEQTKLTLDTGLLPAGKYLLGWYCEIKTTSDLANSGVVARLYADVNGGGETERGTKTWNLPAYNDFSGSFPIEVDAGEQYELRLAYERLGASSNEVFIRRARMYAVRTEAG